MAFDWSSYLAFANELKTRTEEPALRSAVSRAYYSAFNTAEAFLKKADIEVSSDPSEPSHNKVWRAFRQRGRDWDAVYNWGDALKRKRVIADYRNSYETDRLNWQNEANFTISRAESILATLDRLAKTLPGNQKA
jgi:uncharacterized protein (UPF0332 family)